MWTSLKLFCSGDRALLASHCDRQLGSFSNITNCLDNDSLPRSKISQNLKVKKKLRTVQG